MELLLDTDFIIKAARYGLLGEFESLMKSNGYLQPFRHLYEISRKIDDARGDPMRSEFGSHAALNACWSFVADGRELDKAQDFSVFDALRDIEGMHAGEALLVEYALRQPDSIIVTGDKRMIAGLTTPDGDAYRQLLQNRILHLERVVWTVSQGKWNDVRAKVCKDSACDVAIYDALRPDRSKPDAEAALYKLTVEFERRSRGVLRSTV